MMTASLPDFTNVLYESIAAVFRLWLALVGVRFVAHTDHAINASAASVGAMLILVTTKWYGHGLDVGVQHLLAPG